MTESEVPETRAGGNAGPPPLAIFAVIFGLLLVSIGAPLLLLGVGQTPAVESPTPSPIVTLAVGGDATSAPAAQPVRVLSSTGTSTPAGEGNHRLTFSWALSGANEHDSVTLTVHAGNELLGGIQEGTLDPSVFNFSTGRFTVSLVVPCSQSGWTGALLTVRGVAVEGEAEVIIPEVECT